MSPSESNIISGLKRGDAKAFGYLYKLYYNRLLFFAKQLTDDEPEAQDIVSGVFMKLWNKQADFDHLSNIKAFLYIAVRNSCFDFLKQAKRVADNKKEFRYWADDKEEAALHLMMRAELLQEISTEIDKLPPKYQAVCKLSFYEGLKSEEIADALQLSVKTVRNIRALAVKQIQTVFLKKRLFWFVLAISGCVCA